LSRGLREIHLRIREFSRELKRFLARLALARPMLLFNPNSSVRFFIAPKLQRRKAVMNANIRRKAGGLTLVEVLVVVVIIGLMVSMLLPKIGRTHCGPDLLIHCINNQRQIAGAFHTFAMDNDGAFPCRATTHGYIGTMPGAVVTGTNAQAWQIYQAMWSELQSPKVLLCARDRTRAKSHHVTNFNAVAGAPGISTTASLGHPGNQNAAISYGANRSADELLPLGVLTWDRNIKIATETNFLTTVAISGSSLAVTTPALARTLRWVRGPGSAIHDIAGIISMADGSVERADSQRLQAILLKSIST
jgi:hypothetical protein